MTKTTTDIFTLLFFIGFYALVGVIGPLAILWALNTLFPVLAIPYSFYSWLSVVVLNLTWMYKPSLSKGD